MWSSEIAGRVFTYATSQTYIFTDFSLIVLLITERGVKILNYNWIQLYISIYFFQFLVFILKLCY